MLSDEIKWDDLPEDLKEYFDEDEIISFQSFLPNGSPTSLIPPETYQEEKLASAKKMVKHRRYVSQMKILYEKYESGQLDGTQAEKLMQKAKDRYLKD